MSQIEIPAPSDFSFESTVVSHGWYVLAPFRWNGRTRTLHRVEELAPGVAAELRFRVRRRRILIEADTDLTPFAGALTDRARRMFQLGVDLSEFHERCAGDPVLRPVAARKFGRLLCGSVLFEDVVKIIATTNTAWRQTVRMVDRLTSTFGTEGPGGAHAFPTTERLASLGAGQIQATCGFGYRGRYIEQLAVDASEGRLDALLATMHEGMPTEERLRVYQKLPGIGPYGAAHLLAMEGRHDFIAVDTEFRRFVRTRYHGGREVRDATLLRRYAKWGRWKYLAYWSELWGSEYPELAAGGPDSEPQ